jgi:hypothetical protein
MARLLTLPVGDVLRGNGLKKGPLLSKHD